MPDRRKEGGGLRKHGFLCFIPHNPPHTWPPDPDGVVGADALESADKAPRADLRRHNHNTRG